MVGWLKGLIMEITSPIINPYSYSSVAYIPFISEWKTDNTSSGSSNTNQVKLPLILLGTYNFTVDWGDLSSDNITVWNQAETTHTYSSIGTYTITITGQCHGWTFANTGDRLKILDISQWGNSLTLANSADYFLGCNNLEVSATDSFDLTGVWNFTRFFSNCYKLTQVNLINFEGATTMSGMFNGCILFNQDISGWDVSNVTNMNTMFYNADAFNIDIGGWDVSNVTDMHGMFQHTNIFNQDIDSWDVSKVTDMSYMFYNADGFNQDLNSWNTSSVTNMEFMFYGALLFDGNISSWDVSGVTNMGYMFAVAPAFSQDITGWDVSSCTTMSHMFFVATSFKHNIGGWDVTNVTVMTNMFNAVDVNDPNSADNQTNYDGILNGWAAQTVKSSVSFHGGSSKYSTTGATGRGTLTGTYSWTIIDGGPA